MNKEQIEAPMTGKREAGGGNNRWQQQQHLISCIVTLSTVSPGSDSEQSRALSSFRWGFDDIVELSSPLNTRTTQQQDIMLGDGKRSPIVISVYIVKDACPQISSLAGNNTNLC